MHLRHYTNGSTKKPSSEGLTRHEVANIEVFSRGVVRAVGTKQVVLVWTKHANGS